MSTRSGEARRGSPQPRRQRFEPVAKFGKKVTRATGHAHAIDAAAEIWRVALDFLIQYVGKGELGVLHHIADAP